jgi:hypothetical protein
MVNLFMPEELQLGTMNKILLCLSFYTILPVSWVLGSLGALLIEIGNILWDLHQRIRWMK